MSTYDCGANSLVAVLAYYGFNVREKDIMDVAGTTIRYGTSIKGIIKVVKKFGLRYKSGEIDVDTLKYYIHKKKYPVIIALQAWKKEDYDIDWKKEWRYGHYVIPIGYDKKHIYFEDPSFIGRTYLSYDELEERWHDMGRDKKKLYKWGIVIYGKKPRYRLNQQTHMD